MTEQETVNMKHNFILHLLDDGYSNLQRLLYVFELDGAISNTAKCYQKGEFQYGCKLGIQLSQP